MDYDLVKVVALNFEWVKELIKQFGLIIYDSMFCKT